MKLQKKLSSSVYVHQVVHIWDLEICSNDTCPMNSKCFNVHRVHPICRCDTALVMDDQGNCVYGTKLFLVEGIAVRMKFIDQYRNSSSVEFLTRAQNIQIGLKFLLSSYQSIIGLQVTKIYQKQVKDQISFIEFLLSVNDSTLSSTNIKNMLSREIIRNGSIINADPQHSNIASRGTDMCELKGHACNEVTERCNVTSSSSYCICAEGYTRDEIDLDCADESDTMEIYVVIPICVVVVMLLCLGGYVYHRRYSTGIDYKRSKSNKSVVSFSDTSF